MSQPPRPPRIGEVVNGYQWNGTQWVPVAPPQVGQVVNGHRWDGYRWVPVAPAPQVGQVVNGHRWDGYRWVPVAPAPQVGQVANGHRWDGVRWVPLAAPAAAAAPQQQPAWQQPPTPQAPQPAWQQPATPQQPAAPQPAPQTPSPVAAPVPPAARPAAAPVSGAVLGELRLLAEAWQFSWQVKGDLVTLSRVIAERKAFLSTARLEYVASVRVDDTHRELRFTELLKETGAGMSTGGSDFDSDLPTGFGVQRTSYNTRTDGITQNIEDQAARFGSSYRHDFPYQLVREQVAGLARAQGYGFRYGA